jgi:L-asparagine oxygenase
MPEGQPGIARGVAGSWRGCVPHSPSRSGKRKREPLRAARADRSPYRLHEVGRAGFPREAADAIEAHGFAVLPAVEPAEVLSLAYGLGVPTADSRSAELVKDLRPVELGSAANNTLSARFGTGAFPLHTETAYWRDPVRYLMLYCVEPGHAARATVLADPVVAISDEDAKLLRSALWTVRRIRRPFLTTVIDSAPSGRARFRFDAECMAPADQMASRSAETLSRLIATQTRVSMDWKQGDVLVLDNHRLLHGRAASDRPDPDRHLQRVLVSESDAT